MAEHPVPIIRRELDRRFPDWRYLGDHVCRPISGSSKWSEHAYETGPNGEGNALDIGIGTDLALGDAIFDWLTKHGEALRLYWFNGDRPALWRVPNHWDHLHLQFVPVGGGTRLPECKGGEPLPVLLIDDPFINEEDFVDSLTQEVWDAWQPLFPEDPNFADYHGPGGPATSEERMHAFAVVQTRLQARSGSGVTEEEARRIAAFEGFEVMKQHNALPARKAHPHKHEGGETGPVKA